MKAPKFKIGDAVTFTNDYGVVFKGKRIVGFEKWADGTRPDEQRYFYAPSDSPWFSVPESALRAA